MMCMKYQLVLCCVLAVLACCSSQNASSIKKVHVVFMNHLDVGYNGIPEVGFINNVLNHYFTEYFPRAARIHEQFIAGGYTESFIYTTHPWLVGMYLFCPPHLDLAGVHLKCPNATEKESFMKAVKDGAITWHAGPMNMQIENMPSWLWEYALNMGKYLDAMFGFRRSAYALSQRDVPGMTQAVIPSLVDFGVIGITVGVNTMSSAPAVPRVFNWQYGGKQVMATWHPGGYPDDPGSDPVNPGGISVKDCSLVPGFSEALCFAFRSDNQGPPMSVEEVLGYYEILRAEFPAADSQASTLEDYFLALNASGMSLPVVTEEMGDTWIQGVASDPRKVAEFRTVGRVMGKCLEEGTCSMSDPAVVNSSMLLTKVGEHTWGLASISDNAHWSNRQLDEVLGNSGFKNCTSAWLEQRDFTYLAIDALGKHPVVSDIVDALKETRAAFPDLIDFAAVDPTTHFTCTAGDVGVKFSPEGALSFLSYNNTQWASDEALLGKFLYKTYDETDFTNFGNMYNYNGNSAGYTKPNMTVNAHPQSRWWPVTMTKLYSNKYVPGCDFYAHLEMVDTEAWIKYGAPRDMWVRYIIRNPKVQQGPGVNITFQYFGKTTTRLPEALFFEFSPSYPKQATPAWRLSKLGNLVDPNNVMLNGSQQQHAVDDGGLTLTVGADKLHISSLDVSVVCPISTSDGPTAFPAPLQPIRNSITGMAFNLYNNVWNTNYIYWYPYIEEDKQFKARFQIDF